jgi:hypothetical protein
VTFLPRDREWEFNPIAAVLVLGGAAAVGVGLTVGPWLTHAKAATVSNFHRTLSGLFQDGPALSEAYFSWLSWAMLVAALALGTLAICPFDGTVSVTLRLLAFAVGTIALIASLVAIVKYIDWIKTLIADPDADHSARLPTTSASAVHIVLSNAGYGMWLTLGGFLAIGVGGLLGPLPR